MCFISGSALEGNLPASDKIGMLRQLQATPTRAGVATEDGICDARHQASR
jgi:hypothetical protein